VANYPGHFTPDSVWQLAQGRAGVYNDWHPPIMAWLLGVADRVRPGAWLFLVCQAALFHGGLLAFAALEPRPRLICIPLLALWMATPIVLIGQGVAIKDVLFANAAMAGFAALAWAGKLWIRPLHRYVLLALAFGLLSLAGLARQNGFVAPVCGVLGLVVIVLVQPTPVGAQAGRLRQAVAQGVLALALMVFVQAAATWALEAHGDHRPEIDNHRKVMQLYDLAGATRLDPSFSLAILDQARPDLARFIRLQAAPHFRAAAVDNLVTLPGEHAVLSRGGPALGRQWASLIVTRPWLYIRTRAAVWTSTVMTPAADNCPMVMTGVDSGDPRMLRRAGLRLRDDAKDDWDDDYSQAFLGTPLYSHLFHAALLALALIAGLLRWRRGDRNPALVATMALGVAALLVAASYFVISIACDYRFLYFLDVAAMAATVREAAARR
jgi:hypothetical protein